MNRKVVFWGVNILLPIILGVTVYVLFRPDTYVSQFVYSQLGFNPKISIAFVPVSKFVKYYLCDILWAYSLTFSMIFILKNEKNKYKIALPVCIVFEIIIELLQLCRSLPGTFDFVDMFNECVTTILIIFICRKGKMV